MSDDVHGIADPVLSIGTIAKEVGLSISAIRKYEREGLIIPHKTATGRRFFSVEDVRRIRMIQHMIQDLGLNMEGIRRLLALLPCWKLSPFRPVRRESCAGFKDSSKPCWMTETPGCVRDRRQCRTCPVYRFGTQHAEHMKRLLFGQTDPTEMSNAIKALISEAGRRGQAD